MDIKLVTDIAADIAAAKPGWSEPVYIDAGASGAVFQVEHPDHGRVALKVYDPSFFAGDNALIEEARVALQIELTELNHTNLIRTIEAEKAPDASTWFLLMEFCEWPSLQKALGAVPDANVPSLIGQLAKVVAFLREHGFVHRDIKPANIAISPDFRQLKLLDLGVLRKISIDEGNGTDIDHKRRFVATAQYSPPEYILREEPLGEAGFDALNIYQIGAVLHDLIMKEPIFKAEAESLNRYVLFKAIVEKIPTVFSSNIPARLSSVCRAALTKEPARRLAAVTLDDFVRTSENPDNVRKRFASKRRRADTTHTPSLLEWKASVAQWIAEAAAQNRDVLGPFRLKEGADKQAVTWILSLDDHEIALPVRLAPDQSSASLRLVFTAGEDIVALHITSSGPDIPQDQILPQIVEQLLFALDSLPENETEKSK